MKSSYEQAMKGALVADALAMPVHWYYDTEALDRDYGKVERFMEPRNPHPDSILWRSKYVARNKKGEILHDQAQYWGKRGVHYHQFLRAGENTVNFRLGSDLYHRIVDAGSYDADAWLDRYIEVMRTPGWHRDTYLEEYHRAFFDNLARGKRPRGCGIDDLHIGGLTSVPFLLASLAKIGETDLGSQVRLVRGHLELTHRNGEVLRAGESLTRMLHAIDAGQTAREALESLGGYWAPRAGWSSLEVRPDREVVGRLFSPACYLPASFSASLALVWKYGDDFSGGVRANAECGGDNCHRGAVVGSLLGASCGVPESFSLSTEEIPAHPSP